ncbi:acetaldehyde dehydrogenase [Streptomyces sp. NPDC003860]
MTMPRQLRAVVIGAGVLGLDLAERIQRSPHLRCVLVAGRPGTAGLRRAEGMGLATSTDGVAALAGRCADVVFDASNAAQPHGTEWAAKALWVDLTPRVTGRMVVPTINGNLATMPGRLDLVSCGGQTVLPILDAISRCRIPEYAEVVTTAASASAGRATRLNLDEYLATTEAAVRALARVPEAKVLANLSPALPAPVFRARVTVTGHDIRSGAVRAAVDQAATAVRGFCPGYAVTSCVVEEGLVLVDIEVRARGGLLPSYAGNVEIINAAAVLLAERYAAARDTEGVS